MKIFHGQCCQLGYKQQSRVESTEMLTDCNFFLYYAVSISLKKNIPSLKLIISKDIPDLNHEGEGYKRTDYNAVFYQLLHNTT